MKTAHRDGYKLRVADIFFYTTWVASLTFVATVTFETPHLWFYKMSFWLHLYSARYWLDTKTQETKLAFLGCCFAFPLLLFIYGRISNWEGRTGSYLAYPEYIESPLLLFGVPVLSMLYFEFRGRHLAIVPTLARSLIEIALLYPIWCYVVKVPILAITIFRQ